LLARALILLGGTAFVVALFAVPVELLFSLTWGGFPKSAIALIAGGAVVVAGMLLDRFLPSS
jgi:hypothetical protein